MYMRQGRDINANINLCIGNSINRSHVCYPFIERSSNNFDTVIHKNADTMRQCRSISVTYTIVLVTPWYRLYTNCVLGAIIAPFSLPTYIKETWQLKEPFRWWHVVQRYTFYTNYPLDKLYSLANFTSKQKLSPISSVLPMHNYSTRSVMHPKI